MEKDIQDYLPTVMFRGIPCPAEFSRVNITSQGILNMQS